MASDAAIGFLRTVLFLFGWNLLMRGRVLSLGVIALRALLGTVIMRQRSWLGVLGWACALTFLYGATAPSGLAYQELSVLLGSCALGMERDEVFPPERRRRMRKAWRE